MIGSTASHCTRCIIQYAQYNRRCIIQYSQSVRDHLVRSDSSGHQSEGVEGDHVLLPNGPKHDLRHGITCDTRGIVYILTCVCQAFYIGKRKRQLRQRLLDHVYDVNDGRLNKPICHHVGIKHKYDPRVLTCRVLEHIPEPPRGGE